MPQLPASQKVNQNKRPEGLCDWAIESSGHWAVAAYNEQLGIGDRNQRPNDSMTPMARLLMA